MTEENPELSNDDPAYAPDAFEHGITQDEIDDVLLAGVEIPMNPSERGNSWAIRSKAWLN